MTDSALSFVGQINTEYREACKAESNALQHAIKCGEYLTLAKENVKAEKGKWLPWLQPNCPEIPQTTASLYMRLGENKDKIADADAKSIREALASLGKTRERKGDKDAGSDESSAENGADEQDDADDKPERDYSKLVEEEPSAFEEDLQHLAPDELCKMLFDIWDEDQIRQLGRLMLSRLEEMKQKAASTPLTQTPPTAPTPRPK
jgi:hypothetical protein